jgi:hypothetical protein
LYSHSNILLKLLQSERPASENGRPIIFVGHSLGGIIIKSALIHASKLKGNYRDIYSSTIGVLFFGTPHQGTRSNPWVRMVERLTTLTLEPFNARTLKADLHQLELLLEQYKTISLDFCTACFYEGGDDMVPDETVSKLDHIRQRRQAHVADCFGVSCHTE